ncbi:MAG: peptidase M23 [Bacteroidia bacterium]|nr:MAG: peptidase M23 [Bacteroidia bacterium]
MITNSDKKNLIQRLIKERFRITFFHDDFKPVFSLRFTLVSLILWLIGYATLIIIITTIIIANTSLKEYIPGYGTTEERKQITQLLLKTDSLQILIHQKDLYLNTILKILKEDRDTIKNTSNKQTKINTQSNLELTAGKQESELRQEIEQELHQNIVSFKLSNEVPSSFQFLPPTRGILINKFSIANGHYGIDIVGKSEEPIRSIQKGVVVYSGYTSRDGNVIIILHPSGILSIYKHLSMVVKHIGDYINTNEYIGNMGNTGTESNGVHLHFELWFNQKPLDPLKYIVF